MQNQLPDAVRARDRMRGSLMRTDAFEDFEQWGAVPRLPLECPLELLF